MSSAGIDVGRDWGSASWLVHYILPSHTSMEEQPWEEVAQNSHCCWSCTGWPCLSFPLLSCDSWRSGVFAVSQAHVVLGTAPVCILSTFIYNILKWTPPEFSWVTRKPFIILPNMLSGTVYKSRDSLAKCTACSPGFHVIMKWITSKTS
jgi:hypothetical protein